MIKLLKNFVAVVGGIAVGSAVNMGIILLGGYLIPPPDGADVSTMEGLQEAMRHFQPHHFLMPFLAHAAGTFIGAFFAAIIAVNHKIMYALLVSLFFLAGGIINVIILPSPIWFTILDLALAYIPMGYLAGWLSVKYYDKSIL
jgi:hypothetical protein